MSQLADLSYDIEQLWIEGYSPKTIAVMLGCPIEMIYEWMESESLEDGEASYDPYDTVNS
jgi:uncharacterized protein YjcR